MFSFLLTTDPYHEQFFFGKPMYIKLQIRLVHATQIFPYQSLQFLTWSIWKEDIKLIQILVLIYYI